MIIVPGDWLLIYEKNCLECMQLPTSRIILIIENQWLIYWDDLNISKDEVQNFKQLATLQMNLTEEIK